MRERTGKRSSRRVGAAYEEAAAGYLISKGYCIRARNMTTPCGEIDIVAEKDGILVFCECKFRSTGDWGDPLEAVDIRKQRRISRAAMYYYAGAGYEEGHPCRFDVIAIYGDGRIAHLENAFDYQG